MQAESVGVCGRETGDLFTGGMREKEDDEHMLCACRLCCGVCAN